MTKLSISSVVCGFFIPSLPEGERAKRTASDAKGCRAFSIRTQLHGFIRPRAMARTHEIAFERRLTQADGLIGGHDPTQATAATACDA